MSRRASAETVSQEIGGEPLEKAQALNGRVIELFRQGKYGEAIPLAEQALEIRKKFSQPQDKEIASSLNNLALLYKIQGQYSKAEPLYIEAKEILGQALGKDHPDYATSLNNLAVLYQTQGQYSKAEPLYIEAKEVLGQARGKDHPDYATFLKNLAALYQTQGQYSKAEPLYIEAKEVREQALGKDHPDYATSLNSLAGIYAAQGRYSEAELLYIEAKEIREQALGKDHPDYATSLNHLAALYRKQGRYSEAEPLYIEAKEIRGQALGKDHPEYAISLNNLAVLYENQSQYSEAEPLYIEAKEILGQVLGKNHPNYATSLNNLAELYRDQGRYSDAEPLYIEAKEILGHVLGKDHSAYVIPLRNLAELYLEKANFTKGISLTSQALNIEEFNLTKNLLIGAESQKRSYLKLLNDSTNFTISAHTNLNPTIPIAKQLALKTIFRRKGRGLEALSQNLLKIKESENPEVQQKIRQLQNFYHQRTVVSNIGTKGIVSEELIQKRRLLQSQINDLETELSRIDSDLSREFTPVTIDQIQSAIPDNATLVEFIRYKPYKFKAPKDDRYDKPHYAVYTLNSTGEIQWADLGLASELDALISRYRQSLRSPQTPFHEFEPPSHALYQKLIQPIESILGSSEHLLIAPDSQLNLIPFEALINSDRQYLIENHQITYLSSGRDLLRLTDKPKVEESPPLLIASPDYGSRQPTQIKRPISQRSTDLSSFTVKPLANTLPEGKAIAALFPESRPLFGQEATEAKLKQSPNAKFLHIATHGFFLSDESRPSGQDNAPIFSYENPLLRSGLALAGFNQRQGGEDEDGVLSALEVTGLDLRATQLVTLSACQTGVGEVANGEGVYGLRRAFTLAGAQSQVMSLWNVNDPSTKDLMVTYYQRLKNGEERGTALRQVQLDMLTGKILSTEGNSYAHPYYWAAFVRTGDWKPLK